MAVENGYTYTPDSPSDGLATITSFDPTSCSEGYDPVIPETFDGGTYTVSKISTNAFKSKSLTSVTFNYSLELGNNSFALNSGIAVNLNADLTTANGMSNLTGPFEDCSIGSGLTIDSSVTSIPAYIFAAAGVTGNIVFSSNMANLYNRCFHTCSLDSVTFNNAINLDDAVFYSNTGIAVNLNADITTSGAAYTTPPFWLCDINDGLTIGSSVTSIPSSLFSKAGLTEITFPSSVVTINNYAFYDNDLISVVLGENIASVYTQAFSQNSGLAEFYVYNDSVNFWSNDCLTGNMSDISPGVIYGYTGSTAETLANAITNYIFSSFPVYNLLLPGQYVKIYLNSELRFTGVINKTSLKKAQNAVQSLRQSVECTGLNNIPARRTIKLDYAEMTTASVVVNDMIDDYLSQEGIEAGEIDDGIVFQDEWVSEIVNISEVLDECSSRSGFQWFVDKDMKLNFYQDATTVSWCTHTISDSGSFDDFRDVTVDTTIDNYVNKMFVVGGNDDHGDLIYTVNGDLTKQNEMQNTTAGTGVHGLVHRDSSIVKHDYKVLEAGTSATQINYTAHPMVAGDWFWNITRDAYGFVTEVLDADSFECTNITGQIATDEIEVYQEANGVGRNMLKRQSTIPTEVNFKSFSAEFYPQTKLTVSLSDMTCSGIFNIEEVNIKEKEAGYFVTTVKAVKRIETDFSTQNSPGFEDYFRGF